MPISTRFLLGKTNEDAQAWKDAGAQPGAQAVDVAAALGDFIAAARQSIHIAIYDFRLTDPALQTPVVQALKSRVEAGVEVRIAFDHGKPQRTPGPLEFAERGADPAPPGTRDYLSQFFDGTNVQLQPIAGSKLMHNKYVIRDRQSVWTGSTNFTDDAWSLQDNNIITIDSSDLCGYYEQDFQDLWTTGTIVRSGSGDRGTVDVAGTAVDFGFAPGEGPSVDSLVARTISAASRRIRIASMDISSHQILGALDDILRYHPEVELKGIYDKTQMEQVVSNWQRSTNPTGVSSTWEEVSNALVGKASIPYGPDRPHNFMHNKVVVSDDTVVTGSFNFSHSATQNAENVVVIHDATLAQQYAEYIDHLITTYA